MRVAPLGLLLALSLGPGVPLSGQAPAGPRGSPSLDTWRAALAAETDTLALLRLEQEKITAAKARRDSALLHLELGFLSLRLGELGGRSHFEDAAGEFEWVIELEPRWAYPWYGLALAEQGLGDSRLSPVAGVQAMLRRDKLSRSAAALIEALEVEPDFAPGLTELARVALTQRFNASLDQSLMAFRRAAGSPASRELPVLLARGRIERLVGSPDSALAAFRAYASGGGDVALALLEEARTLFVLDSLSGQAPYYAGAALDDPVAVSGYRDDIVPIATETELQLLDAAQGPARAQVLRAFWDQRDRQDLREDGERVRQHYQRLHVARLNYRLALTRRRYDTDERYRSGSTEFDDRGIIYVRHGTPSDSAWTMGVGACYNLSWLYRRPEGDLIFHFVSRDDVDDYRLVQSLMDIADAGGIQRIGTNSCDGGDTSELVRSRTSFSPLYDQLLVASSNRYAQLVNEDRSRGIRAIAEGTTTDRYPLSFATSLEVHAVAVSVGAVDDDPLLQVAFAVRGATLRPDPGEPDGSYTMRVRLVAMDGAGKVVATVDSTKAYRGQRVSDDGFLVGRVALPVPPGPVSWRLAVQQGADRGALLPLDSVVASPVRAGLALSGLALGTEGGSAQWLNSLGDKVLINPLGAWRTGEDLELYAEVYGATAGAPLAVELIATRRKSGSGYVRIGTKGRSLTVKSDELALGPLSPIRKTLSLASLSPGNYVIALRVTDAAGTVVERQRSILVRPAAKSPLSSP
jgi:GWxTD domain-containing protein